MRVASLFTGIGGFELGLRDHGYHPVLMCENDPNAQAVLQERFPDVPLHDDIATLSSLPECDVITAGWPCQDLSQAGRLAGCNGNRSGLISHVFRLIDGAVHKPKIVLLENVAFALSLKGGGAIQTVTSELESRGYRWAYRILDSQQFGLPQRRRRIFICAMLCGDPKAVLLSDYADPYPDQPSPTEVGFYWTEGNSGIGWTPNAIPPLKGGSALLIPSPPAIWHIDSGRFFTPGLSDAERLQGFPEAWTDPATEVGGTDRVRWRLVGNAVSVPVARWIGSKLSGYNAERTLPVASEERRTHNAAWGGPNETAHYIERLVEGPFKQDRQRICEFGLKQMNPLSLRATAGFARRYERSRLRIRQDFLSALHTYTETMRDISC